MWSGLFSLSEESVTLLAKTGYVNCTTCKQIHVCTWQVIVHVCMYMDTSGSVGWVGERIQVRLSWSEGYVQLQHCSWQISTERVLG